MTSWWVWGGGQWLFMIHYSWSLIHLVEVLSDGSSDAKTSFMWRLSGSTCFMWYLCKKLGYSPSQLVWGFLSVFLVHPDEVFPKKLGWGIKTCWCFGEITGWLYTFLGEKCLSNRQTVVNPLQTFCLHYVCDFCGISLCIWPLTKAYFEC